MTLNVLRKLTETIWMFAIANTFGTAARRLHQVMHHLSGAAVPAFASAVASAFAPIMSPSSQNNKEQMTIAGPAKISHHQTRGCYVQRSKHGFCPGGRIRSLL
jgi:hypothetical protein